MEAWIHELVVDMPLWGLFAVIAVCLLALGKGADLLVDEAVALSERWGVPKVIIGATIVSLGTTLPEAAVSVLAALKGNPNLALGNAVGSIITDCGLILGVAALLSPLPLDRKVVNRQGWIQIGAGILLVLFCFPWMSPSVAFSAGGQPAAVGGLCFGRSPRALHSRDDLRGQAFAGYRARCERHRGGLDHEDLPHTRGRHPSRDRLVERAHSTVEVTALRLGVPEAIIAATLVAFGTSLPELVTCVAAVRRGHGELAIGNVIGADILNVLFVAGLSAAVTSGGLDADPRFFRLLFPGMLTLLVVFRVGIFMEKERLSRGFGAILLGLYLAITTVSYLL